MHPDADGRRTMIHLDISARRLSDGSTCLTVSGEIDSATADELLEAAENAAAADDHPDVVVDLTGVTFLDSAGIRTLLMARRTAAQHGAVLRVTGAGGHVRKVLTVTGVLDILTGGATGGPW
jgi:anti-anti-sigma factor